MSQNKLGTIAHINPASDRAEVWRKIFGTDKLPIKSPIAILANIPELGRVRVYLLDVARLSHLQREHLVTHLRNKNPEVNVEAELELFGMPILADDVGVISDSMFFL